MGNEELLEIREVFGADNIHIESGRIRVYVVNDGRGEVWCPFDGGPVVGRIAIDRTRRLFNRICRSRDMLPENLRDATIQLGVLTTDLVFTLVETSIPGVPQ